jgi:hypothetical protein
MAVKLVPNESGCVACGKAETDKAHIRSKGAGGTMDDWNIVRLCRFHHQIQHAYGWAKFLDANPDARSALEQKGWKIEEEFGVRRIRRDSEFQSKPVPVQPETKAQRIPDLRVLPSVAVPAVEQQVAPPAPASV